MDNYSITQFFTPDNVNLFKDLIISGMVVMLIAQTTKRPLDSLIKAIPFIKSNKCKTKYYTLFLSFIQAIYFMFVFNDYSFNATSLYITVINTCLLYVGTTKGFDFVFKNITVHKEQSK